MLEGEWMVEFFAPWCPACKALQPIWKDFASWGEDLGISVAQVDVTDSPGLSGRFMVTALPTIYHVKDGVFRQYRGPRDKEQFLSFVEEKKWMEAEEVPAWKSPGSYQMAVVSQFFKLSMVLRGFHSVLVKDYGLPEWGSYLIFALCTILVGALIGLILVCIIDFMFPPKPSYATSAMATRINDQEEDLLDDSGKDQRQQSEEEGDEEEGASGTEQDSQASENEDQEPGTESQREEDPEEEEEEEEEERRQVSEVRKRRARKAD